MLKPVFLAALLSSAAAVAYAQTPPSTPPANTPSATTKPMTTTMPAPAASADTRKLIGRNVKNTAGDTIGEIKSVFIGPDGKVDSVMVGVGGFLGVGEREVRMAWSDLNVTDNGEKVTVNMTKDQLAAKPEYKYRDTAWRGQVFNDAGPWKANDMKAGDTRPATATTADNRAPAATKAGGDFNADGQASGSGLIGASVRNGAKETVGKIEEIWVDKDGAIKTVVISVGGFLGMGAKNVAMKWSEIQVARDGNDVVVMTNATKDSLKAMPEYKETATVPQQGKGG